MNLVDKYGLSLLQLQAYSDNELIIIDGIILNIDEELEQVKRIKAIEPQLFETLENLVNVLNEQLTSDSLENESISKAIEQAEKLIKWDIYTPEFIAKIKQAEQNIKDGKTTEIDPKDIWGSLGLKEGDV